MTLIGTTRVGKLTRSIALLLALTNGLSACAGIITSVCGSEPTTACRNSVVASGAILGLIIIAAAAVGVAASDDGDGSEGGATPAV